jgi:uncharacterized protein (DUF2267 family)
MPMPFAYRSATKDFEKFLEDLLVISSLATSNQCYTQTRAVFLVFRSHVEPQVALDFANTLPPVLRAIFIEDWNLASPVTPMPGREKLLVELKAIREAHNFSTNTAITEVAAALRQNMNELDYGLMLRNMPAEAAQFWKVETPAA